MRKATKQEPDRPLWRLTPEDVRAILATYEEAFRELRWAGRGALSRGLFFIRFLR